MIKTFAILIPRFFYVTHNLFNRSSNTRSRRLKAYSIVHYTYSKISLKMAF